MCVGWTPVAECSQGTPPLRESIRKSASGARAVKRIVYACHLAFTNKLYMRGSIYKKEYPLFSKIKGFSLFSYLSRIFE